MKPPLSFLADELRALEDAGFLRARYAPWTGRPSFCSNDYLGLGAEPVTITGRPGATASRLVAGHAQAHEDLERDLSGWVGSPAALLFPTGHAANVGLLQSLAGPGDLIVSDALNHASIIDGARLSKAEVMITPHLDVGAIERCLEARRAARAFVVVESYYSMDADSPDLPRLREITARHGAALLVDEAHALGMMGLEGRGLCAASGVAPDALVGTLGKAFGAQGGFVAGSDALARWLWNRARTFVFSTGLSPLMAEVVRSNLPRVRAAEPQRRHVAELAARLRAALLDLGQDVRGRGHVIPWVLGERALATARALRDAGFEVQAIRPPTVPPDTARLRLTITARHSRADVEDLVRAIQGLQLT